MLAVEMKGITKRFAGMTANDSVDLMVEQGEIHSLLGENGAGKTTLMKILFGLYQKDEGTLKINGTVIDSQTPQKAFSQGLGMVHQHFMLIENLSVWENVVLGSEPGNFFIDRNRARAEVEKLSDDYDFNLDINARVGDISVGMKQRVEILKTLYKGAQILILDEPTAVLTPVEAQQLLDILVGMKKEGKTIIFITHKLKETMAVSDHVTILRGGKMVCRIATTETSKEDLAARMVGHDMGEALQKKAITPGAEVLRLAEVRLLPQAQDTVSFSIRAGEIFGIAGVEGNGQQQLEELIMGIRKCQNGNIFFKDSEITYLPIRKRVSSGIGYIPSDRHKHGILPDFSLYDNYLLGNQYQDDYVKHGLVRDGFLTEKTAELMKEFDVRAVGGAQKIGSLSGGNQQKVVVSREAARDPAFVLACQPVRGLDIGAIRFIHEVLLKLREQGKAILLISAELTDLFQLSDRIGVMYKGELTAVRPAGEFTPESISLLMAGRKEEAHEEHVS